MKLFHWLIDRDISEKKICLHFALFIITYISCALTGTEKAISSFKDLVPAVLSGYKYAIPLLTIITFHEGGHYLMAKKHRVRCTLPYYIPFPINFIGTLGAFIKIKEPITDRKAMFDIAVSGPLAGFAMATIFIIIGLPLSETTHLEQANDQGILLSLGEPLLFKFLSWALLPSLKENQDIILHPTALAGWIGYLITALNLIPVGQLDGGHLIYSLFPKHHKKIAYTVYFSLVPLCFLFPGWVGWLILLYFMKIKHPDSIFFWYPLDQKRKQIGYCAIMIFILLFTPIPIEIQ